MILGPSGSGKSTLLRTINHLEKLDRGSIDIDGELVGYRRHSKKDRSGNETFTLHELPEREVLRQRTQVRDGFPELQPVSALERAGEHR